jgi:hypothetical protein
VPGTIGTVVSSRSRRPWNLRASPTSQSWTFGDDLLVRLAASGSTAELTYLADDSPHAPPVVIAVEGAIREARRLLVESLGLVAPTRVEFVIHGASGDGFESHLAPSSSSSPHAVIFLNTVTTGGNAEVRGAAIRLYVLATLRASGFAGSPSWGESIARWTQATLDGQPDAAAAALLGQRLARLDTGLFSPEPTVAAGNAIWLAYLHEAHGLPAVRMAIEELLRGVAPHEALDRAARRVTGEPLAVAFRDFHLWTIFTGQRASRHYFSFAHALPTPAFASSAEGLPALSVHTDPALAPWGATQVRLLPAGREGGLRVHFEGDFLAQWQADLLLTDTTGALRRVALPLSPSGRGQITVPQQGLVEAVLLIRNLGSEDGTARRYTYAAYRDRAYPVEWGSSDALPVMGEDEALGVLVSWETTSELDVIGFNVRSILSGCQASARSPAEVWPTATWTPQHVRVRPSSTASRP